ncbi:helix-turn-helix domain-containing protein [Costertonia aggregata]|uniref:Helix-turn-helix transcriptional regulator n=1 Tax=Costertonia aggregata TaxID=343403 RepID=A0A7H9AMQ5_9FLAO|nr:helix-turn-helix transcriptional regulator [Costertonia aggregata]QLG44730.1 helix-turn-helix transcriptional regulator [Costertonia aggregata]
MIGTYIRNARERQGMLLRELAAELNIDTAMLSKMERGVRPFRKEDLKKLSSVLNEEIETLRTQWLADKVLRATENEKLQSKALELALSKCKNRN